MPENYTVNDNYNNANLLYNTFERQLAKISAKLPVVTFLMPNSL